MKPGHNNPSSNERTVPETAPTANSTAVPFAHRCARSRYARSPVRRHRHSASTISRGMAIPISANTMWKPSENAIWVRAASRSVTSMRLVVHGDRDEPCAAERRVRPATAPVVVGFELAIRHVDETVADHGADGRLGGDSRLLVEHSDRHDAVS